MVENDKGGSKLAIPCFRKLHICHIDFHLLVNSKDQSQIQMSIELNLMDLEMMAHLVQISLPLQIVRFR